jgi:CRP/FNR family cyclic AMP-dependent transcriptional regulator
VKPGEAIYAAALAKALGRLSEETSRETLRIGHHVSLAKGQRLFSRGDDGSTMFIVVTGMIEISVSSAEGRKVALNLLGPFACFGEISMLDGKPRTADAFATMPTELFGLSRDTFLATAMKYPELGLALAFMLGDRLRWVSDTVEDYALLPLDRRLARRLLVLFDRFGGTDNSLTISQSDLADFAGATRESTNRQLIAWQKRGWIGMLRKSIQLRDRDALSRLAELTDGPVNSVSLHQV